MYCNKCGTKLLDDSQFCTSCGCELIVLTTIRNNTSKAGLKTIKKISTNKTTNIIIIILSLFFFVLGINLERNNYSKIATDKDLIQLTEKLIDLKDSNPILGSSYSERQELKDYKTYYKKHKILVVIGTILMIVALVSIIYMAYNLILIIKRRSY